MELQNGVSGQGGDMGQTEGKFLTFWTAEQLFAISINNVEQIVGMQEITRVPDSPAYAKGIINLRGNIIPVIDMRLRLNKDESVYTDRTCIIITKVHEDLFSFIVDGVDEVTDIPADRISRSPQMGSESANEYIGGVARLSAGEGKDDKIVLLLDITKILPEQEVAALKQAAR